VGVVERRKREKRERREAIVEAAESVFLREGFETCRMDAVAAEAEVSKGTLYLYFHNKDELRAAIAERWVSILLAELEARLAGAANGLDGVRQVLETYRAHFDARPDHCRMALRWIMGPVPECPGDAFEAHRQRVRELVERVVSTIERGQRDGSIRADLDPRLLALQLWGSFLGVWVLVQDRERARERFPSDVDFDRAMPSFHETLLRGIATSSAAAAEENPR